MMSEWITDRLPTEADSDMMNKVWVWEDNAVYWLDYSVVTLGTPWIPNKIPEPYVKPEQKRWMPKDMERYFCIFPSTIIGQAWLSEKGDYDRWAMGNCFVTYNEAAAAMEQVKNLLIMLQTKD
jgi:hypothetical protein